MDLAVPHVDRVDAESAPAQQAVGEPAGGRADVEAHASPDVHVEGLERRDQLLAAPPDEGRRRDLLHGGVGRHEAAGFRGHAARQPHPPGENQTRGLGAARRESLRHEELVEADPGRPSGPGGAHAKKWRSAASRSASSVRESAAST